MTRLHRPLFEKVRKYTSMYLHDTTYSSATGYLLGYDDATEGGLLLGFHEWLVLRLKFGANLGWSALVLYVAFPNAKSHDDIFRTAEDHAVAVDTLFSLLAEFDEVRERRDGLRRVLTDYSTFCKRRRMKG